jgi:hypothetical protein
MVIAERIKVYVKTEESQCGTLEGVCILHDIRGKMPSHGFKVLRNWAQRRKQKAAFGTYATEI